MLYIASNLFEKCGVVRAAASATALAVSKPYLTTDAMVDLLS